MQFFVGLTFRSNHLQYQKLDSFRSRFDDRFNRADHNQLTVVPPFEISHLSKHDYGQFIEALTECMDNQLRDLEDIHLMPIEGIDFQNGEKQMLFLKPKLSLDLAYSLEAINEVVKEYGGVAKQKLKLDKENLDGTRNLFYPLGQFDQDDDLHNALEEAKNEFLLPFNLHLKEMALFERSEHQWLKSHLLFEFQKDQGGEWNEDFNLFQNGERRR